MQCVFQTHRSAKDVVVWLVLFEAEALTLDTRVQADSDEQGSVKAGRAFISVSEQSQRAKRSEA